MDESLHKAMTRRYLGTCHLPQLCKLLNNTVASMNIISKTEQSEMWYMFSVSGGGGGVRDRGTGRQGQSVDQELLFLYQSSCGRRLPMDGRCWSVSLT